MEASSARRLQGLLLGVAVDAYVGVLVWTCWPLEPRDLGVALGFALGVLIAVPIAFDRSTARGVGSALLAVLVASAYARRLGPELEMPSEAQRETPTLVPDGDAAWISHRLGVEVRVSPRTSLTEDEAALRAGRYAALPPEMTGSSWTDVDAGLARVDLLAVRVSRIDDVFCETAARAARQSLEQNGATVDRTTGDAPCDRTMHGRVLDRSFASRLVVLGEEPERVWVTVSAIGDRQSVDSVTASARMRSSSR